MTDGQRQRVGDGEEAEAAAAACGDAAPAADRGATRAAGAAEGGARGEGVPKQAVPMTRGRKLLRERSIDVRSATGRWRRGRSRRVGECNDPRLRTVVSGVVVCERARRIGGRDSCVDCSRDTLRMWIIIIG